MPELPEVETVRRGLESSFVGRRIEAVEVGRPRTTRRTSPEELRSRLAHSSALNALRRGKYLLFDLDTGDRLMIHLRMSGQALVQSKNVERPLHTHVALSLDGGDELRFVDPRTFGEVVAYETADEARVLPELARLGPDPISEGLSLAQLRKALRSTRRPVKAALLDQRLVAGIGNIYGDEILHRAGVSPLRAASSVNLRQSHRIHESMFQILNDAIEAGGSTLSDSQYVGADGSVGEFQESHRVYARAGLRCITCGRGVIVSAPIAGRTSSWCRACQR